jgi:hypothetical protein
MAGVALAGLGAVAFLGAGLEIEGLAADYLHSDYKLVNSVRE